MDNLAVEVAFATSRLACVAVTPELAVYERAAMSADPGGQVCPISGGRGVRALPWHGSDLPAQSGPATPRIKRSGIAVFKSTGIGAPSVMNNVQLSTSRTGYCALSGTG